MTQQTAFFPLTGGEDLVTPPIALKPGKLLIGLNYEPAELGGYRRMEGYERYDGRPSPTAASYWTLPFDQGNNEPTVGDTISGSLSGASGHLLTWVVESGSWATNDAAGYLVLSELSGIFEAGDSLTNGVQVGNAAGPQGQESINERVLHYTYLGLAVENRRSAIGVVPGSGPVRGVWYYDGDMYAFRDNAGATACVMHKASASGWLAQDLGAYVEFTAGTSEILEGETIAGGTSLATGDVVAVVVSSGDWSTNDAAGRIYLKNVTGTFQAETITSATGSATCSGAQTINVFPAGGRYEFINENFGGTTGTKKMFGVSGTSPAFQWDGTGFAWIITGMEGTGVHPTHIAEHKRHLFLSFGPSIQHSSIGNPLEWSVITGASEIATGDNVVGFKQLKGDVLCILNRNSTYLLYGTSTADWNLKTHSKHHGGIEWTIQTIGGIPHYLDDSGITNLVASDKYGDFEESTISKYIEPYVTELDNAAVASLVLKRKNQYRIFFADGRGVIGRIGSGAPEFTRFSYADRVYCACAGENSVGSEIAFVGLENGYVAQIDTGGSHDGKEMLCILRLPFNHLKSPRNKKKFFKAVFELESRDQDLIEFGADYSYGDGIYPESAFNLEELTATGGYWDVGITWGEFFWDAPNVATAEAYIGGHGLNISLILKSESTYQRPHTLHGITLHYGIRGLDK